MDEFIKLLDPAYELIQYRLKEDKVIFLNNLHSNEPPVR